MTELGKFVFDTLQRVMRENGCIHERLWRGMFLLPFPSREKIIIACWLRPVDDAIRERLAHSLADNPFA